MAIRMQVHGVSVEVDTVAEAVDVIRGLASDAIAGAGGSTPVEVLHRDEPKARQGKARQGKARKRPQPVRPVENPAMTRRTPEPATDSPIAHRAAVALRQLGPAGTSAVASHIGVAPVTARRVLLQLAAAGTVHSTGNRVSQRWHLGKAGKLPAKEDL